MREEQRMNRYNIEGRIQAMQSKQLSTNDLAV